MIDSNLQIQCKHSESDSFSNDVGVISKQHSEGWLFKKNNNITYKYKTDIEHYNKCEALPFCMIDIKNDAFEEMCSRMKDVLTTEEIQAFCDEFKNFDVQICTEYHNKRNGIVFVTQHNTFDSLTNKLSIKGVELTHQGSILLINQLAKKFFNQKKIIQLSGIDKSKEFNEIFKFTEKYCQVIDNNFLHGHLSSEKLYLILVDITTCMTNLNHLNGLYKQD